MKALLLAAGLGSRLRPLTSHRPKPLCLFYGEPLLDLIFKQLRRLTLQGIAINTHHLGQLIEAHVKEHRSVYTPPAHISYEPEILGTGGCLNPLRSWLGNDHLLIYNGDIIADIDLHSLIAQHEAKAADATMVLLPRLKAGTTPVFWNGADSIAQIGGVSDLQGLTFTGVHIVGPRLQNLIPRDGFQHIIDAYQQLLNEGGRVQAFIHRGFWADLGTPQDYFDAHLALCKSLERDSLAEALGLDPGTQIFWGKDSAAVGQRFEGLMEQSFLFGPVDLNGLKSMRRCIVYPSSQLAQVQHIQNKIVTPYGHFDL